MTNEQPTDLPEGRILTGYPAATPTARFLFLLPLLIGAIVTLYICGDSIRTRISMQYPLDWWESMFITDAARAVHHVPVYEKVGTGHATHMYGPLGTYLMAAIYSVIGTSITAGRWVSLVSGIASTILFVIAFTERRKFSYYLIGAALFLSLHIRCIHLFTNTRPDSIAFLLASIALFFAYRAQQLNQILWYLPAALLIVISFLFKQTFAVTAVVPPLAVFFIRSANWKKQFIYSLIPLAGMVLCAITLKAGFPRVWFYMVTVPKLYSVKEVRVPLALETLFMYNPFYLAVIAPLLFGAPKLLRDDKSKWLYAAMIIGGGMGILAFAKQGGTYNSLLMVYAPMAAFCMLKLPLAVDLILQIPMGLFGRVACSLSLPFMLSATATGTPITMRMAFTHASNTPDFKKAVALAKSLDGRVVCVDEPVITLLALGQFDPSLEAEIEALGSGKTMQRILGKETSSAKYVISVNTSDMPSKSAPLLRRVGFRAVQMPELGAGYVVWQRVPAAPATRPATAPAR